MSKFGGTRARSLGTIIVRIPTPSRGYIEIQVDVVRPNIPLLIGLDALDKFGLYVNNVRNLLVHDNYGWGTSLERSNGYVYFKWGGNDILFTIWELKKMHLGFYHPSTEKLFNLIRSANLSDATPRTQDLLQHISYQCKFCQFHAPGPLRFTATIPGKIVFNLCVILDLMWIIGKPVLHIVDSDTHYSAARFVTGESTEDVWQTFLQVYQNAGIAIEITPIESSNCWLYL